jgi:ABC-2 type transport system permease protein
MSDLEARSVLAIARKDFDDAVRSKVIWLLGVLFTAFFGLVAILPLLPDPIGLLFGAPSTEVYLGDLRFPVSVLFPIIGLMLGYKSIVGELQSGTGKILHTLPHTRLDVVVGKFLGRTIILWLTLSLGLVVALFVMIVFYDTSDIVLLLQFGFLSMVFSAAWVSIGVGISSIARSTGVAAVLVVGIFFFLWISDFVRRILLFLLERDLGLGGDPPTWFTVTGVLAPGNAYNLALPDSIARVGAARMAPEEFYTSPEVGLAILCAWIVLPVVLGYLRFQRTDL